MWKGTLATVDLAALLAKYEAGDMYDAVAYVRSNTGARRRVATAFVQAKLREAARARGENEESAMGMQADVYAVGTFHPSVAGYLDYPEDYYAKTPVGAELIVHVIGDMLGTTTSRRLAACLRVDPWDFGTHAFDPWRIDTDALREFLAEMDDGDFERFVALREAGFRFYFRPNG